MDRSYLRATRDAEVQVIVQALQRQQFVRPHQAVPRALEIAGIEVGFCRTVAKQAMAWLQIDAQTCIGRLRRSELLQLARSLHRIWRQNAMRGVPTPDPMA
jgi:hypothetical protein